MRERLIGWYSGILVASGVMSISVSSGLNPLSAMGITFMFAGFIGMITTYFYNDASNSTGEKQ